jgi:L-lactate dehydrogenase complex protein LldG
MSGGRDAILGRVRSGLGRSGPVDGERRAALEVRLRDHKRGIIPNRTARDRKGLADLFVEMAEAVQATTARVPSPAEVPDAVADYLARHNLGSDIRMAPDERLDDIPWQDRPTLSITRGRSDGGDGVTAAFAAVAETGTLMMHSGPATPTTLNFLPDNHVVVLRESQIRRAYEDGWDLLRQQGAMPRTVNFVTGPSRSGDIEQTLMLGAHGPRRLHIILIADGAG